MKRLIDRFRHFNARGLLKNALAAGFSARGVTPTLCAARRLFGGPRVHIIGYHRVVDRILPLGPVNPTLGITTDLFRKQMEQLRRCFVVLPLDLAVEALCGRVELPADACAITFDDGYRDVLERAHPILAELGLPATVFVPTGFVGSDRPLLHDRLYAAFWSLDQRRIDKASTAAPTALQPILRRAAAAFQMGGPAMAVDQLLVAVPHGTLEKVNELLVEIAGGRVTLDKDTRVLDPSGLRTLADGGWEIGAHTIDHVVLTHEPDERVKRELEQPRIDIERWTGRRCRYFSYCNGLFHRRLLDAVRCAGYVAAVTTSDWPNVLGADCFRLQRKVLWDGHVRDASGEWSEALSAAHLSDLFGMFGLTSPVDGEVSGEVTPTDTSTEGAG